jgi:thymidylate synthase (FAD)
MHQDYSSNPVWEDDNATPEAWYGQKIVEHLLAGDRGHYGCFEHPSIAINCCYYPHSVMQQARTHRVGISFDVQSFRYTSDSLLQVKTLVDLDEAIYLRPAGVYTDRKGHRYTYTQDMRNGDLYAAGEAIRRYQHRYEQGLSEEHARGLLPFDYRQHFVMSLNARSLMHFLDLRGKRDAQLEIQWLADDLFSIFQQWMPETAAYYESKRLGKGKLAP